VRFDDAYFSREELFSLGTELDSGRRYVSFPVSFGGADGEEHYVLAEDDYQRFLADPATALPYVDEARRHEHDDVLLEDPGERRGTPLWPAGRDPERVVTRDDLVDDEWLFAIGTMTKGGAVLGRYLSIPIADRRTPEYYRLTEEQHAQFLADPASARATAAAARRRELDGLLVGVAGPFRGTPLQPSDRGEPA
jgi:hypothetical protein